MNIQYYKPTDIIMAEYNPRQLTKDQYSQLKDSLTRFGLVDPLIINKHKDRKNILVGGHQRLRVATELGLDKIPCVEVELPLDKEKELNIRLNKNVGEWDYDSLANHFDVGELTEWGFSNDELQFYEDEPEQGLIDDDEIPEVEEAVTKLGDLWLLGEHRVLCGDATKKEDVERLMDNQKADMVFTDPPYGVNVKGGAKSNKTIAGDLTQVAIPFSFDLAVQIATKNDARLYFCGGEGNLGLYDKLFDRFLNQLPRHLIWVKNGFVMKPNNYHNQYEIIYFGYKPKGGGLSHWFSARKEENASDVWKIKRDPSSSYLHPTQKPVELAEKAIKNSSPKQGLLYEPFLGSGSTLIAAEKTNRKCYGMELDPHYCDVIVKRWEEFTGKKAERVKRIEG